MTDQELLAHIDAVQAAYSGNVSHLTAAVGALMLGRLYGWRVVRITTSTKVYARHQRILGVDFKRELPEITKLSEKSVGYRVAMKLGKFWEIVKTQYRIETAEKMQFD